MKINYFDVEMWMTDHENDCQYNLTETCMSHMSLNELQGFVDEDIKTSLMNMTMDYGDITGSMRLKKAILSLYEKGDEDNLALTHGAINANEFVMMTLLEKGDHVISLYPTYQQMYDFPKSLGCEVSLIELKEENDWIPSLDDFVNAIQENTKMICLNLPNNPTGTTLSFDMMMSIIDLAKENDIYILCDEVYRGFDTQSEQFPVSMSDYYEKAIVTQSLSKIFSFAGLRLGWIKGPKDVIDLINERRDYHIISVGPHNDYLASLVLENKDVILKRNEQIYLENQKVLKEWLEKEPLVSCVVPHAGPVCFLKYHLHIPSKQLCEKLQRETGVFFVPGSCFGIEHHLRLGMTHDPNETKEGLDVFSKWLDQYR